MNAHELEDRLHRERIVLPEGFDERQEAALFRAMAHKRRPAKRTFQERNEKNWSCCVSGLIPAQSLEPEP